MADTNAKHEAPVAPLSSQRYWLSSGQEKSFMLFRKKNISWAVFDGRAASTRFSIVEVLYRSVLVRSLIHPSFVFQNRLHSHLYFFCDFLVHNFRNFDIVVCHSHCKTRFYVELATFVLQLTFNNAFLFDAMKG